MQLYNIMWIDTVRDESGMWMNDRSFQPVPLRSMRDVWQCQGEDNAETKAEELKELYPGLIWRVIEFGGKPKGFSRSL